MAGISVQHGDSGPASMKGRLAAACHDDRYESQVVVETDTGALGYTGYAEYPVTTCRVGEYTVAFEGHVYDWDRGNVAENLRQLVTERFAAFEDREAISRWVRTTDGEFVLVAVNEERGDVTVVGDCLGRLPLYYAANDGGVMLSREHSVVVDWLADAGSADDGVERFVGGENTDRVTDDETGRQTETDGGVALESGGIEASGREMKGSDPIGADGSERSVSIDRLALSQYLLFGYTLGSRTLVEGVKRLPSAPFVRVTDEGIAVERLCAFDFGKRAHADRSREENAARLARLFERGCRRRAGAGAPTAGNTNGPGEGTADESSTPDLISLSGGLGSRAVLAAFAEGDLPCIAATMDHPGVDAADVEGARELAARYEVPWRRYGIGTPDSALVARHAALTDARDPLVPGLLSFFDDLRDEHGSLTYFTGAGGDETLASLPGPGGFGDTEDLLSGLVATEGRYAIEDAAALAGVGVETLEESIRERLRSYPETDPDGKYVRFRIEERARNWLFEAEDTDRRFFWSTTPFYSLPFFRYAMGCPDEQKRWYRLYRSFLGKLSARSLESRNAKFELPPGSVFHTVAAAGAETLGRHPEVLDAVKPLARRVLGTGIDTDDDALHACITAQVERSALADRVLSTSALEQVLAPERGVVYSRRDIYLLLTATTYLDHLAPGQSVLERRPDLSFE